MEKITLEGTDNYGKPRQDYADRLAKMDEAALLKEAEQAIWLSAYAANNPRSDYHWWCAATYAESVRRGKPLIYNETHLRASA